LETPKPKEIPEGILGIGYGEASILSQLKSKGVIQNVVGHCLTGKKGGGGYLIFGDKFISNYSHRLVGHIHILYTTLINLIYLFM